MAASSADEFASAAENWRARGDTDYVASLQRIAAGLVSGNSLREVLQQVVEAICDHTSWQLSWIYAMDRDGGFGEIVARRDRMGYTKDSPLQRWPFIGTPSLEALQRNEIIAVPDVTQAFDYPALQESAIPRGVIACAYVPLASSDASGRPMLLCVQSGSPLLSDPTQLPFLKAVASLTSLAVSNAALLTNARGIAAGAIQSAELLSTTMAAVSAGTPPSEILERIESASHRSIVVFDGSGHLFAVGRPPAQLAISREEWRDFLEQNHDQIFADAERVVRDGSDSASLPITVNGAIVEGTVTRFGEAEEQPSVIVTFGKAESQHRSAATATAMVHLRERLVLEAQVELQLEVMAQILGGSYEDRLVLSNRAAFVGIDVDQEHFLVVQEHPREGGKGPMPMPIGWPGSLVQPVAGCIVYLLPGTSSESAQVDKLLQRLVSRSDALVTRSTEPMALSEIPTAWRRCLQTIELAQKVGRSGIVRLDDFGAYRVLLPALERLEIAEFIEATIGTLLGDEALGAELFATAEAFVATGGRFQETARRLFIHVSTLRYRLKRINELLGRDISDDETRFEISLAIHMERLRRDRSVRVDSLRT